MLHNILDNRRKPEEVKDLPECMKICFWTLFNTTDEIAVEIQKEKGWNSVLPHLQKAVRSQIIFYSIRLINLPHISSKFLAKYIYFSPLAVGRFLQILTLGSQVG